MAPEAPAESGLTVTEVTGLISVFAGLLTATEERILTRLAENSTVANDRWSKHDRDAEKTLAVITRRFEANEVALTSHVEAADRYFAHQREGEIATEARVAPVRTAFQLLVSNWRTILLALFSVLAMLGVTADFLAGR